MISFLRWVLEVTRRVIAPTQPTEDSTNEMTDRNRVWPCQIASRQGLHSALHGLEVPYILPKEAIQFMLQTAEILLPLFHRDESKRNNGRQHSFPAQCVGTLNGCVSALHFRWSRQLPRELKRNLWPKTHHSLLKRQSEGAGLGQALQGMKPTLTLFMGEPTCHKAVEQGSLRYTSINPNGWIRAWLCWQCFLSWFLETLNTEKRRHEACLQPFFPDTVPGSVTDDLGKRNWTRKTSNECCLLSFLARSPSDIPLNMSSDHRKAKPCISRHLGRAEEHIPPVLWMDS